MRQLHKQYSLATFWPLQMVAVDILGPPSESTEDNSYLFVVGDYFTKLMEAYPIPAMEAITTARTLVDQFFVGLVFLNNCILTKEHERHL